MGVLCLDCRTENETAAATCSNCGAALYELLARGAVVDQRYEIACTLGVGGMGVVYRAHDRALDETVALKALRPDIAASPAAARRFIDEIKLARRIAHRNVCRIFEYGQAPRFRYICMELIEGTDLRRILRSRTALPEKEVLEIAEQIAAGLAAIHAVGIVHRDLKTSNIMLDKEGIVRLMDFGLAKEIRAADTHTLNGQIVGTPEYLSPEQARGEKVDPRSDIYAFGVVLYELFTGRVPFKGDTPIATILKHLSEPLPVSGPAAERIPEVFVPVLTRAMAKDPGERFATVGELAAALRRAREHRPTGPTSISETRTLPDARASGPPASADSLKRGISSARLRRIAVWLAAAILVGFALAGPLRSRLVGMLDSKTLGSPVDTAKAEPATARSKPTERASGAVAKDLVDQQLGLLQIVVTPSAEIAVDAVPIGTERVREIKIPLQAGRHSIRFTHPDFQVVRRKADVEGGKMTTLVVDLSEEAVSRKQ